MALPLLVLSVVLNVVHHVSRLVTSVPLLCMDNAETCIAILYYDDAFSLLMIHLRHVLHFNSSAVSDSLFNVEWSYL